MPTIAIDCRFAATASGIGRYTRDLVGALLLRRDVDLRYILLCRSTDEAWLHTLPSPVVREAPYAHYSVAEQLYLPRVIRACEADLFFSPHFNVPLRCPVPFVATVHDLILHHYPNSSGLAKRMAYRFLMRHAVRSASALMAVSAWTERELRTVYGADLSITVTHEGVHPAFRPQADAAQKRVREAYDIPGPFLLYVGNAKQHKNVPFLLEAFMRSHTTRSLVLVASGAEARSLWLPHGVKRIEHVGDTDLPALYSAADACVTASLYEGFGLPIAEAQACGCPVIALNTTAIPEVADPRSAILVEPNIDAFAATLAGPLPPRIVVDTWHWNDVAERTAEVLLSTIRRSDADQS